MPLWGKTDAEDSRPKWIDLSNYPDGTQLVFVDEVEARQPENKARGIRNAGWWLYRTYTDANGSTRYDNECLVAISNTAVAAGDASDDAVVVDRTITITTAPVATTVTAPAAAVFTVVAAAIPTTTLSYKWQTNGGSGTTYTDLAEGGVYSGVATDTLTISDSTGLDGYEYRVVVSADGAADTTVAGVTLTVA